MQIITLSYKTQENLDKILIGSTFNARWLWPDNSNKQTLRSSKEEVKN